MRFEVGAAYTREQVQALLDVPKQQRGGAWDTGYRRFKDQLWVFCNVGSAGRTGHDYDNRWEGDELVWFAKTGTHVRQDVMRSIIEGGLPVQVFWRGGDRQPFTYAGSARVLGVEDTTPVRFRFGFGATTNSAPPVAAGLTVPQTLGDLLGRDGRLYAKSEFGPVHDGWPAISFSSRKIAADFSHDFWRGQDFVLFVGTGGATTTENPEHRRRVLSAVTFEPNAPISTQQIVPAEHWQAAVDKWGVRWEWSFPVTDAWDLDPFPEARDRMPHTYARLGSLASLGRCIPVDPEDLPLLLQCSVKKKALSFQPAVERILNMNPTDADLKRSISQMAIAIQQRIEQSGQDRAGHHPLRKGPNLSDLIAMLNSKWADQKGCCQLCGRPIPLSPANRLLQMSPDRIDSGEKAYDDQNVHLTHLGCNLAKSNVSMEDWQDFLAHLRG